MTQAPVIETERLVLRLPQPRDAEPVMGFYADSRARFFGGPLQQTDAWRRFALDLGHWMLRGFGMWAVEERATGAFCGMVGCWFPEGRAERELGWFLLAEAEGRGIGAEAARAARSDAYRRHGWQTLVSYIHPDNHRSIRLAERLGAQRDDAAAKPADDPGALVYRHPLPAEVAA